MHRFKSMNSRDTGSIENFKLTVLIQQSETPSVYIKSGFCLGTFQKYVEIAFFKERFSEPMFVFNKLVVQYLLEKMVILSSNI